MVLADCSRIVKDFYMNERDAPKRPKIFGMTASPVDAKVDVVKAARYDTRTPYPWSILMESLPQEP